MACARYRDALSEYAAGSPATAVLAAHLPECADCQKELASMRRVLALADQELGHLSKAEPSVSFVTRLRAAVIEADARSAPSVAWRWPALATAAAVVLAITLFAIMRPAREIAARVEAPSLPASAPAMVVPQPASRPAISPNVERTTDAPPPARRIARRRPVEPEVLVPPGEAQVLKQWVALVNREHRVPALLAAADALPGQMAAPANIEIKPIEIVPLDSAMSSGT